MLAAVAAAFASAQFFPGTSSSFTNTTDLTGNTIAAKADWTAPTVTATVLQKSAGGVTDTIKQGGTFYVYANATDSGNPASGVASITASVSNIATVSSAAMSSGSWTVGGTTYGYRSAQLTAKSVLSAGTYSWSATATDAAGYTGSAVSDTVAVDNVAPDGDSFSWDDEGLTVGKFEGGEKVSFTYDEAIDPNSIVAGWDGSATTVSVLAYDASVWGTSTDILIVANSAGTVQMPVGTAYLNGDYFPAGKTAVFSGSTMTLSGSTVTVTLGTVDNATNVRTNTAFAMPTWVPQTGATDPAGNASTTTSTTSFGVSTFTASNKNFGTSGKPETGDTVSFAYSKAPSLGTIVSGWSSGTQSVTVRMTDKAVAGTAADILAVYSSGGSLLPLGTVTLNGDHVNAGFTLNFTGSTMSASGGTINITLGTPNNSTYPRTDSAGHKPVWSPDVTVTDAAGAPAMGTPTSPASNTIQF